MNSEFPLSERIVHVMLLSVIVDQVTDFDKNNLKPHIVSDVFLYTHSCLYLFQVPL